MQEPTDRVGLFLSRLIRLGGIVIAMHEEFFGSGDRSSGFALAAVMMSGSLLADTLIKRANGNGNGNA